MSYPQIQNSSNIVSFFFNLRLLNLFSMCSGCSSVPPHNTLQDWHSYSSSWQEQSSISYKIYLGRREMLCSFPWGQPLICLHFQRRPNQLLDDDLISLDPFNSQSGGSSSSKNALFFLTSRPWPVTLYKNLKSIWSTHMEIPLNIALDS